MSSVLLKRSPFGLVWSLRSRNSARGLRRWDLSRVLKISLKALVWSDGLKWEGLLIEGFYQRRE